VEQAEGLAVVDGSHLIALLVCQIGKRVCALPADRVGETMRPLPITPIPDAPLHVLGMTVVRGEPMPVLDLCRLLGEVPTTASRFVTISAADRKAGEAVEAPSNAGFATVVLAVDQVEGIRRLPRTSLHRMPTMLQGQMPLLVSAVSPQDTALMLVLDSVRLLATVEGIGPAGPLPDAVPVLHDEVRQ
jgi:purine-binding chemotaxis protein CheW